MACTLHSRSGLVGIALSAMLVAACSATGDETTVEPDYNRSNSTSGESSSDSRDDDGHSSKWDSPMDDEALFKQMQWVEIQEASMSRGAAKFTMGPYMIATTEVTQEVYRAVMGKLPKQEKTGDRFPVQNVSWFDAALFCNAFSKRMGRDTAYVYTSSNKNGWVKDLTIDYAVNAFRLPTEMEWEFAARGGTTTTYYWDRAEAKKYAYYAQSSGPSEVAQFEPNAYSLYDMAGNVAEWVNDWYGPIPTHSVDHYAGPETGTYRCVRGGGWSDKVDKLELSNREKKDPQYSSPTVGLRLVYARGK